MRLQKAPICRETQREAKQSATQITLTLLQENIENKIRFLQGRSKISSTKNNLRAGRNDG